MLNIKRPDVLIAAAIFLLVATALTLALIYYVNISLKDALTITGALLTSLSLFIAVISFRDTHEWNRRHFTVELGQTWNSDAREHLAFLSRKFPDYFKVPDFICEPSALTSWRLPADRAERLVKAEPEPGSTDAEENKIIRDRLISVLNYFENIAMAYQLNMVNRDAILDSFGCVMLDTWTYFYPFVESMRNVNRRDPWPPVTAVITEWEKNEKRLYFEKQAEKVKKEYEDAQKVLDRKRQTGI